MTGGKGNHYVIALTDGRSDRWQLGFTSPRFD